MNKTESKERSQGVNKPAHSGGGEDTDRPSQRLSEFTSLFPFKNFHDRAETSDVVLEDAESTFSPDCRHSV